MSPGSGRGCVGRAWLCASRACASRSRGAGAVAVSPILVLVAVLAKIAKERKRLLSPVRGEPNGDCEEGEKGRFHRARGDYPPAPKFGRVFAAAGPQLPLKGDRSCSLLVLLPARLRGGSCSWGGARCWAFARGLVFRFAGAAPRTQPGRGTAWGLPAETRRCVSSATEDVNAEPAAVRFIAGPVHWVAVGPICGPTRG
jgi:hypothetical protein